jgi:hypothetical protein
VRGVGKFFMERGGVVGGGGGVVGVGWWEWGGGLWFGLERGEIHV